MPLGSVLVLSCSSTFNRIVSKGSHERKTVSPTAGTYRTSRRSDAGRGTRDCDRSGRGGRNCVLHWPEFRAAKRPVTPGRPETIEQTAEMVTAAGGVGVPVRVDHTQPNEVKRLMVRIKRRHGGLDILVNDVWGGDALTEFGKPFWTLKLDDGLHMLKQAIHSHIITAHYAVPLMLGRKRNHFRNHRR